MIKNCSTQELVRDGEIDDPDRANLLILGRGDAQELKLSGERAAEFKVDDPWLSVLHASILQQRGPGGTSFHLEDRRSTNGCRLNGRPVTSAKKPWPGRWARQDSRSRSRT